MYNAISKLKHQKRSYSQRRDALNHWYCGYTGQQFLALAQPRLEALLADLFGYYLLQVGELGSVDLLGQSRIKQRVILDDSGREHPQPHPLLPCEVDKLSIVTDSVDVVVLPHTLEIHDNAHQILREVDRILVPEGHVLVMGFNPYSLWGGTMWLQKSVGRLPWQGHFLSPGRVKDWLKLLGYEIEHMESYFYRPALRHPALMDKLMWLERWGARYWPILGGGYILVARKQVSTLTPIRPRWQVRRRLGSLGVAQSSMQRDHDSEES